MTRVPDDPTKAQVWADQVGNALKFEFFIPRGPKGDPGGLTSTALASGQDLNTFTTSGLYVCGDGNFAQQLYNYPVQSRAGQLLVMRAHSQLIHQVYYLTDYPYARTHYERSFVSGSWQPWRAYASQRVDQSAGRAIYAWDDLNNRDQLIYGDTGSRDVKADVKNGWTVGLMSLRRVGNMVSFAPYNINGAAQTGLVMYTIPAGFRPAPYGGSLAFPTRVGSGTDWISISSTGDVSPVNTAAVSATGFLNPMNWVTGDTWPTTLPGVAAGAIPNV